MSQVLSRGSIIQTSFNNNSAGANGGAILKRASTAGIFQSGFNRNSAGVAGGAIYEVDTEGFISQNRFVGNTAPLGPAIATVNSTQVNPTENSFLAPQSATDVASS